MCINMEVEGTIQDYHMYIVYYYNIPAQTLHQTLYRYSFEVLKLQ